MKKLNDIFKNAVLYKDMLVQSKRRKMASGIFALTLVLAIAAALFLIIVNAILLNGSSVPPTAFSIAFVIIVIFDCAFIVFFLPGVTAPAIANEREQQTLDVLLTTGMTYPAIIFGKFLSAVIYTALMLLATLPFLSIVFIYGGVSLFRILLLFLGMLVTTVYLASFGIYFSVTEKKATKASAKAMLVYFLLIGGIPILCLFLAGLTSLANLLLFGGRSVLSESWSVFMLVINPAAAMLDLLEQLVGIGLSQGSVKGMNYVLSNITSISSGNIFFRLWSPISFLLEMLISIKILADAAKKLDPTRKRKYANGKKRNTKKTE